MQGGAGAIGVSKLMKLKKTYITFGLITLIYIGVLVWIDARADVFVHVAEVFYFFPVLLSVALLSWIIRYARWRWLLSKKGVSYPEKRGFLAYLSGFAFTASPGKVGELVRLRYFVPMGVSHDKVISAFLFERLSDLIAVLILSLIIASQFDLFWVAVSFVGFVFICLLLLVSNPSTLRRIYVALRTTKSKRLLKVSKYLIYGINGTRIWFTPKIFLISITFGLVAWGLLALSFFWLLREFDISIDFLIAIALYPLSMLVGAASMIPGGLGSTEATIVALLYTFDVPIEKGVIMAVTIRIATLWSAILIGSIALLYLERMMYREQK
jgi:uncharacterized protein (TIRG00374 family)